MSNVIQFPAVKAPTEFLIVDGGWLKGFPIGGEEGQFYFVTYHYDDGTEDSIADFDSYSAALSFALAEAAEQRLRVIDKTEGAR
jgi:hypothetical protein